MRTRDSLVDNEFLFKAESSSDQEKQDEIKHFIPDHKLAVTFNCAKYDAVQRDGQSFYPDLEPYNDKQMIERIPQMMAGLA